jgi:hypothetical protein
VVADIEARLHDRAEKEISSLELGDLVMEHLQKLDQVAYVRFASVYRQFKDISQFMDEVKGLTKDGDKPSPRPARAVVLPSTRSVSTLRGGRSMKGGSLATAPSRGKLAAQRSSRGNSRPRRVQSRQRWIGPAGMGPTGPSAGGRLTSSSPSFWSPSSSSCHLPPGPRASRGG